MMTNSPKRWMKAKSNSPERSDEGHTLEEEAAVSSRLSKRDPSKRMGVSMGSSCEVCWCDLLPELLAMIAAGSTPTDIILFRSVCRSWRWSIPPPFPNKHILSPIFPLKISFHGRRKPAPVTANAVYLVQSRHRSNSKVWMLSAQEYTPGKFLLQHPLTNETIPGKFLLDLSESKVTQIHTGYTYKVTDHNWDMIDYMSHEIQRKVVLVPNSTTGLCRYVQPKNSLCAFPTTTEEEGNRVDASQVPPFVHRDIDDFVSFNGWIYLVEAINRSEYGIVDSFDILMFDYKTGEKFGIVCDDNLASYLTMEYPYCGPYCGRFVVSNGDLFVVFDSEYCRVYRLVKDDLNVPTCCKWERVKDLGDRVFFINKDCSFSASARDLPRPWKGNCLIFTFIDTQVFDLGTGQWTHERQTNLESYLDLFSPPASLLAKKSRKKKIKKKKLELIDDRS